MNKFTIEQLDKILSYPSIERQPTPKPDKYFDRYRHFRVGNNEYHIAWFVNISYLHGQGEITIPFARAELSNTWPHSSKMNIQLYDEHNNICGILKIDDY